MELRPGYKQTELGVLPEGWDVGSLGDVSSFITSGPRGWAEHYSSHGSPFVRITNMSRQRVALFLSDMQHVEVSPSDAEALRTALELGDVLLSITADIGIVSLTDDSLTYPAFINQHIALVRVSRDRCEPGFLARFLAGTTAQQRFRALTDQGAKAGMNLPTVRAVQVALPPLPEQRAIAEALADVDALLAAQDQLIAKKRAVKQAVMGQLLSGKRRLPGFSEVWQSEQIGKLFTFLATGNHTRAMLKAEAPIGNLHYGDVHLTTTSTFDCDASALHGIEIDALGGLPFLAQGDLVVVDASEDVMGLGKSVEILSTPQRPFIAGLHTFLLRPDSGRLAHGFSAYIQFFDAYREGVQRAASGVSVYGLSKGALREIEIPLPPLPEQRAIAAVLSDIDAEIHATEAQRHKTLLLKQGMMSSLLTGRVRLV